jgi:cellobiose-specific phosphotransferase system component IIB
MKPRMIDLVRNSRLPSNLMQFAACGALSVPPSETIEILVHLALHNNLFGAQAGLTLAGWDEKASRAVAADPKTSPEVLGYFVSMENLRTCLLPALLENPAVSEESLDRVAMSGSRPMVEVLLKSARVKNSARLLEALQSNPNLSPNELAEIGKKTAVLEESPAAEAVEAEAAEAEAADEVLETTVTKYLEENAAELAAEKDKPFEPIGMAHEGMAQGDAGGEAASAVEPQAAAATASTSAEAAKIAAEKLATAAAGKTAAALAALHAIKHPHLGHEERRDTTLQKIAKLDVKGRISLAMRGSKEERSILVRDGTKLVALAVLESPKVSDGEVEGFALQKNVLEAVLRAIPMKRRFAKNYSIMRNLVFNPRTPLDLSLGLMKNLLIHDLKNLSANKEVSDTIRKLALRMFKQKMDKKD